MDKVSTSLVYPLYRHTTGRLAEILDILFLCIYEDKDKDSINNAIQMLKNECNMRIEAIQAKAETSKIKKE